MLTSFVCIDFWTSRHFHLHLHPHLCCLFWPQDCLNPEITSSQPQRGHVTAIFFFPAHPALSLVRWGLKISSFSTRLNALAKGIFMERNPRWKSCKWRGSVILQILIIPVKPAALQRILWIHFWVFASQASLSHTSVCGCVTCIRSFPMEKLEQMRYLCSCWTVLSLPTPMLLKSLLSAQVCVCACVFWHAHRERFSCR